jgi:hypothetical protein
MTQITVNTPEGTVTLGFCNEECQKHFEHMKERDQSQIALSQALWEKQYNRKSTHCTFCEEKL